MGSGAIGCLYGGLLSKIGENDVTLVGRPLHVDAIKTNGLVMKGVYDDHVVDIKATANPKEIESADLVIITTKSYDTSDAAESIRHLADGGTPIALIQNGLGTSTLISSLLGTKKVVRATTCVGAIMTGPGEVTATGKGLTEIGSHFSGNEDLVDEISKILSIAGFDVKASDNIEGVVWTKTIVNCGLNPVAALTGLKNGEIHSNMGLRTLVIRLVEEAARVAAALDVHLSTDDPVRYTLGTAKATSENTNSMLQDVRSCKRTEIDAITGEVLRIARELGIDLPFNESVFALIKALEAKRLESHDPSSGIPWMSSDDLMHALSTV